jgi:hypothetical protein
MIWVLFANFAAFETYHDAVCAAHGIPLPGRSAATGDEQLDHKWTTSWVRPLQIGPTALSPVVALVPDEDVVTYGLTGTTALADTDPAWQRVLTQTYEQAIPATWKGQATTGAF